MQTFLPYPNFIKSAKCLDYRRLGKQRVEAKQLLNVLLGETDKKGWKHHPACLMWRGYENALKLYHDVMINEWLSRGYKNTMEYFILSKGITKFDIKYVKTVNHIDNYACDIDSPITYCAVVPEWFTDKFSSYHRGTLLYKDPDWYGKFGWTEEPKYEYF